MDFRHHFTSLVQLTSSSSGMGSNILSRWWICTPRNRVALICVCIIATLFPAACADEPHILQSSHEDSTTIFYYADINITFREPNSKEISSVYIKGKFGINSEVHSVSGRLLHTLSRSRDGSSTKNHYGCSTYINKFPS